MGESLYQARIPNREVFEIYNNVMKVSSEEKSDKLQVLDIEDVNSLEMCIKNYFAQKSHVLEDKNEAMFQSMIYSLFTNECKVETQTHTIGVQIHSGNGIADIIWYPKEGKSTKAIILEVKYANTFEEMNVKLNEASFQIIEKDYPEKVLTKAKNYLLFKNIEFKSMVVFFDKNTNQFEIKSKSYIFEIVEMKRLSYLFMELSKDDRKVLKKIGFDCMMNTYKNTGSLDSLLTKK
jgi:hypothetical protein